MGSELRRPFRTLSIFLTLTLLLGFLMPTYGAGVEIKSVETYITLGENSEDYGYNVAVNSSTGDIYFAGYITDVGLGDMKIVLAKYDSSGNQIWNESWYESGKDSICTSMALDEFGNIYLSGQIKDSGNNVEVVVVKYNSSGHQIWNATHGTCHYTMFFGAGVDVDSSGNVYVASYNYIGTNDYEMELVRYSSSGMFQWSETWTNGYSGFDIAAATGVAVDSYDMIYVTGWCCCPSSGGSDIFLVKYNSGGTELWDEIWNYGGSSNDIGVAVADGPDDYIYVSGTTKADAYGEQGDLCLLKYSNSGVLVWSSDWGLSDSDFGAEIAFDSNGNIFQVGYTTIKGSMDICYLNYSSAGELQSCAIWGGNDDEIGYGIDVDSNGTLYLAGGTKSYGNGNFDMVLVINPSYSECPAGGGIPGFTLWSLIIAIISVITIWTQKHKIKYFPN